MGLGTDDFSGTGATAFGEWDETGSGTQTTGHPEPVVGSLLGRRQGGVR